MSYFEFLKDYLKTHGRPKAFYTDRLSVFRINRPESVSKNSGLTQVGRAMKELDIKLICANSPQAKGRVERIFSTLQDRLVKEVSLRGILSIEGSAFLKEYIKEHNKKFAINPVVKVNVHKELLEIHDFEDIMCYKFNRKLSKNLEWSYEGKVLQIETDRASYAMRGAEIEVRESLKGDLELLYKGKKLKFRQLLVKDRQGQILNRKEVLSMELMRDAGC